MTVSEVHKVRITDNDHLDFVGIDEIVQLLPPHSEDRTVDLVGESIALTGHNSAPLNSQGVRSTYKP